MSSIRLRNGFRFRHFPDFDAPEAVTASAFDDSAWEAVQVPHDWAIHGEFKETNDASCREIIADGITTPIMHSGRTGALPTLGEGVYRLRFDLPAEDAGKRLFLNFDGVMWDSQVYLNGHLVGGNHFGYKSFSVDITEAAVLGSENLLVVVAKVYEDCSRWYPGAGIFRNVYLVKKNPIHIRYDGLWLRQLEIGRDNAVFELSIDYEGEGNVAFEADILAPDGTPVCRVAHALYEEELSDIFTIPNVLLWDVDAPHLYTAKIRLLSEDGSVVDEETVRFGARRCEFTADRGMLLNGRPLKIHGVCNHHDLGSLGAAVNVSALRRQLNLMREMGVNSIRTSHNPPSRELLDLCDEMGFLVMDEFFDEWAIAKIKNGYAKDFKAHAIEDMESIMRRDRNHPCIILWSLGNEILEQRDPEGWRTTKFLYEAARRFDPARPITCGFSYPYAQFENHMVNFVDVVGINYKPHLYREYHAEHPDMKFIGTETASTVSTRGVYHLPAEVVIPTQPREDLTVSAYEMEAPGWAYYAERELAAQIDLPFVAGEYVWTGIDYLGEPTPYYDKWPSRSSYFGAIDIAGLPKNRFYLYRAQWTNEPVLHIFPHWNWESGQTVPVHVYTNAHEVELFVNGRSYGRKTFSRSGEIERFRLMWNDVVYEPGEVRAIAYDENGSIINEASVHTAGQPAQVLLHADRLSLKADGEDVLYVTATIVDEHGTPCPHASNRLFFRTEGPVRLLTTDNGDPREVETFWRSDKKAHAGQCVACVSSLEGACGAFTIFVEMEGGKPASIKGVVE